MSLVEEAVKEADVTRDLDLMFNARMTLCNSAVFSGHNATALVALAWLLAQYNEDPNRFRTHQFSLLWHFTNVLHNAGEFPQISRKQFEDLRHQMEALY